MSVYLTATIKSKTGQEEALKATLQQLAIDSKNEAACVQYDLHQSVEDPGFFIFHEEWTDQSGLDLHNVQPHILKFQKEAADLIEGKVAIYKTVRV
ncbi:putative quinol monooxygenase [Dyadobacter psychrotolerans]|uniref:Antibiotic biosynthesis monooxygenase n=1 Tax=Dyadobacter psychrotolerans TaxID=2541721 RepID=A0A4R5DPA0_9BACT|nr:putative quinol monooxygenase [Dyadobacter psychrotolerans]TDE15397.1 antibiotic biosynthesis monooxygenase [Dyadobacter psychrotolerans]